MLQDNDAEKTLRQAQEECKIARLLRFKKEPKSADDNSVECMRWWDGTYFYRSTLRYQRMNFWWAVVTVCMREGDGQS